MALGTNTADPTTAAVLTKTHGDEVFMDLIQFNGDDAYVAGGTADFTTFFKTQLDNAIPAAVRNGSHGSRQVLAVVTVAADDGADPAVVNVPYRLLYDPANDKLIVVDGAAEVAAGDLSAVRFHAMVLSC